MDILSVLCAPTKQTGVAVIPQARIWEVPNLNEALASVRHTYLGSFFLDPEDITKLSIGAIWNVSKGTGFL